MSPVTLQVVELSQAFFFSSYLQFSVQDASLSQLCPEVFAVYRSSFTWLLKKILCFTVYEFDFIFSIKKKHKTRKIPVELDFNKIKN